MEENPKLDHGVIMLRHKLKLVRLFTCSLDLGFLFHFFLKLGFQLACDSQGCVQGYFPIQNEELFGTPESSKSESQGSFFTESYRCVGKYIGFHVELSST